MSEQVTTSGGPGGIRADFNDMRRHGQELGRIAADAHRIGGASKGLTTSGALLRTAVFSPASAARAEQTLVSCALQATNVAVRVEVLHRVLDFRAALFEATDAARDVGGDIAEVALWRDAVSAALGAAGVGFVAGSAPSAAGLAARILRGEVSLNDLDNELCSLWSEGGRGARDSLLRHLSAFPETAEIFTGGLVSIVGGNPLEPKDKRFKSAVAKALSLGASRGFLVDRTVAVGDGSGHSGPYCQDASGLLRDIGSLTSKYKPDSQTSAIRIVTITNPGEPPRYVIEIPGTQEWAPKAGRDPSDMTSNIQAFVHAGALMPAVRDAMAKAGIPAGSQIMLSGHSQGGIVAAALASDESFRKSYAVTNVVTAGSPISSMQIPESVPVDGHERPVSVHVDAFEHTQDIVPRLDGEHNPDRPHWSTHNRDVGDDPAVRKNAIAAHSADRYGRTAELTDGGRLDGVNAFLRGESSAVDYTLTRP